MPSTVVITTSPEIEVVDVPGPTVVVTDGAPQVEVVDVSNDGLPGPTGPHWKTRGTQATTRPPRSSSPS